MPEAKDFLTHSGKALGPDQHRLMAAWCLKPDDPSMSGFGHQLPTNNGKTLICQIEQ
jgi:hypothetical protein